MTEQKSTQLSPEEWKQLCVLNVQQLLNFLNSVPAAGKLEGTEDIISGMTSERLTEIEQHLGRGRQFLMAWARSKPVGAVEAKQPDMPQTNGATPAEPTVRRRGRPRKVQAVAEVSQH